jgi:hypothetical protein
LKRLILRFALVALLVLLPVLFCVERQDLQLQREKNVNTVELPDTEHQQTEIQETTTTPKKKPIRTRKPAKPKSIRPHHEIRSIENLTGVVCPPQLGFQNSPELARGLLQLRDSLYWHGDFTLYKPWKLYIPPVEYRMKPRDLILPAALISVGAIASTTTKYRDILPVTRPNPQDQETPFDDIYQFFIAPSVFAFDAIGDEKHHPVDQFFVSCVSYGFMVVPVRFIKAHYERSRPYGGKHTFPSGHTATAFVGAHVIFKEFIETDPWIAWTGYAMGTLMAGARVHHNKHWVSDTMAGAGIAILSTELAYAAYFPVRNFLTEKVNQYFGQYIILSPVVQFDGSIGMSAAISF